MPFTTPSYATARRTQLVEQAIVEMREVLSNENSEQALRATSKALAYQPTQADTLVLKRQALNAFQERRRREAMDQ